MYQAKKILSYVLTVAIMLSSMVLLPITPPVVAKAAAATVETYSLPSAYPASTTYSLSAGGVDIPVVSYNSDYDYAEFSMSGGSCDIVVTALAESNITASSISPLKLGLTGAATGNKLSFTISNDEYLIVQINGKQKRLVILADPAETEKPASSGTGIFNVLTQYSADNSGTTITSDEIQKAIDDASSYGTANNKKGIVYIPAGYYKIGNLQLKSNIAMYLEGGAILRASDNKNDLIPHAYKDSIGKDITWLLYTTPGADNIKLYGRGTIDGNGNYLMRNQNFSDYTIMPMACSNFSVDGLVIRDSGSWSVVPVRSNDLSFTNIKFINYFFGDGVAENDCIDVCESQNVLVKHSIGIALDDPYTTKTWPLQQGITKNWYGTPEPLSNVTFDDCISWTICYGFKLGAGLWENQTDVTFKNSTVYDCSVGIGIAASFGTATANRVTFDNIDIERINYTNGAWRNWLGFFVDPAVTHVQNVLVKDINVRDRGTKPAILNGDSSVDLIDGITFDNVRMFGNETPATSLDELNITNRSNYENIRFLQSSSVRQAELFNSSSSITSGDCSDINAGKYITGSNGAWAAYNGVDFGSGVSSIDLRLKPNNAGSIELHLDSPTGQIIGTASIAGANSIYNTINVPVTNASGLHTLYLVMNGVGSVADVNWIDTRYTKVEAESYISMSGISTEDSSDIGAGLNVTDCNNGDWVAYDSIDFGTTETSSMNVRLASAESGGTVDIHLDSENGTKIGHINVPATGGLQNWITMNVPLTGAYGIHDLYFVFNRLDSNNVVNINNFSFIKDIVGNELKLPTTISIDRASADLSLNQTIKLSPVFSDDTSFKDVIWTVLTQTSPNVISVSSSGFVSALNPGTAKIRVTSAANSGAYADCNITVSNSQVNLVSFQPVNISTIYGAAPVLPATVTATSDNGETSQYQVIWDAVDPIKYNAGGSFTVSGHILNTTFPVTAEITVNFMPVPAPDTTKIIKFDDKDDPSLGISDSDFDYTKFETSASDIVYKASNVDAGIGACGRSMGYLKFKKAGDWVEFTINVPEAGTYNVDLGIKYHAKKGKAQLSVDGKNIGAEFDEYDAVKNVIGSVDCGNVSFNTPGEKKFRITSTGTNPATTDPTVVLDYIALIPASGIIFDNTQGSVSKGLTIKPSLIYTNIDTNNKEVKWSVINSSASNVISVSSDGTITGLNEGTATVRVSSVTYDLHTDYDVTVTPAVITKAEPVNITTIIGTEPTLPNEVALVYSDKSTIKAPVQWQAIDAAQYAHEGSFTVTGTVEGTVIPAVANITVTAAAQMPVITAIQPVNVSTVAGTAPVLPSVVTAVYSDSTTSILPVQWAAIDPSKYAHEGSFAVTGTVEGTVIPAVANITVTAAQMPVITAIQPVNVSTVAGTAPVLPSVVTAVYCDSTTSILPVQWAAIDPSKYANEGSFAVIGTVEGTIIPAVANITVTAAAQIPEITAIQPVIISTVAGTAPVLPSVVTAVYSDSTARILPVQWAAIDPSKYANEGNFTVIGTVEGTVIPAVANITVTAAAQIPEITAIQQVSVTTKKGKAPELPSVVTAVYNNGTTKQLPVIWAQIDSVKYSEKGSFTVEGTVEGTSIQAVATITVTGKSSSNSGTGSGSDTGSGNQPGTVTEPGENQDGKTTIDVKPEDIINVSGDTVKVNINHDTEAKEVIINIPAKQINEMQDTKVEKIEIDSGNVTLVLPVASIKDAVGANSSKVQLNVKALEEQKYNISLSVDGNKVNTLNDDVKVGFSYTLKPGENPEQVVALKFDDNGDSKVLVNGKYNSETKSVEFDTRSLGDFAIAYAKVNFTDIENVEWARKSINGLAAREVIAGVGNNSFEPEGKVTRAEFIKMLVKALDLKTENTQCTLTDVSKDQWYYDSIATAQKLGIVKGKDDGSFGVNDQITREDMAVIVYRAIERINTTLNQNVSVPEFKDSSDFEKYAYDAITALHKAGIVNGADGLFAPKDNTTRAESAVIIYKIFTTVK